MLILEMLQDNYTLNKPTIELFVRATSKNGKPCLQVSKFISDPEQIKKLIGVANNTETINAIVTIPEKIKFYGALADKKIIKYDFENDEYRWTI